MSLGLLARDSIQDFRLVLRESIEDDAQLDSSISQATKKKGEGFGSWNNSEGDNDAVTKESLLKPLESRSVSDSPSPQEAESSTVPKGAASVAISSSFKKYERFNADRHTQAAGSVTAEHEEDRYQYDDCANYDPYAPQVASLSQQQTMFPKRLWCCLFPWVSIEEEKQNSHQQQDSGQSSSGLERSTTLMVPKRISTTSSNNLGERVSSGDKKVVLDRLGMPKSEPEDSSSEDPLLPKRNEQKDILNGKSSSIVGHTDLQQQHSGDSAVDKLSAGGMICRKGILKHVASRAEINHTENSTATDASSDKGDSAKRRSLFPSSYGAPVRKTRSVHRVSFAPMARVVSVKSKNDMDEMEKGVVWWQRSDYEDFRKTGRIITKAMLQGGSEIWLASNSKGAADVDHSESGDEDLGDKWWHKFGHSRRGLEHVVSIEEGRDRQTNVRSSIQAVLEEQARQQAYKREDPERLRVVAMNHTAWARELALASGASDADAVHTRFANNRKSREFYLLKMSRGNSSPRHLPSFMQPFGGSKKISPTSVSSAQQQQRLDAHTAARMCYRKQQLQLGSTLTREESTEPIHDSDRSANNGGESLAQRAAGFSVEGEKVNMAAVMSGLGVLRQQPMSAAS